MTIDPRTPVIIGVGQTLHHATGLEDAKEPAQLMEEAIVAAAADAGLAGPPTFDSIRVVSSLSWKYGNPGWVIAQRLGQSPRQLAYTTAGGNTPQTLINMTSQGDPRRRRRRRGADRRRGVADADAGPQAERRRSTGRRRRRTSRR